MSKKNISKCFLSPFVIVILALCIFSLACIAFDINVLKIGKSGFFATPTAYNIHVLKRHFLFMYIPALFFIMNLYTVFYKKPNSIDDAGRIILYSYGILGIYTLVKIIYIIVMPSKTSSAIWFLMPPVLYDILTGLDGVHFSFFFFTLGFCIFTFALISKLLLKFINPYIYFIISNTALVFGTYLAMKFFIYLDEALASFYY